VAYLYMNYKVYLIVRSKIIANHLILFTFSDSIVSRLELIGCIYLFNQVLHVNYYASASFSIETMFDSQPRDWFLRFFFTPSWLHRASHVLSKYWNSSMK